MELLAANDSVTLQGPKGTQTAMVDQPLPLWTSVERGAWDGCSPHVKFPDCKRWAPKKTV